MRLKYTSYGVRLFILVCHSLCQLTPGPRRQVRSIYIEHAAMFYIFKPDGREPEAQQPETKRQGPRRPNEPHPQRAARIAHV